MKILNAEGETPATYLSKDCLDEKIQLLFQVYGSKENVKNKLRDWRNRALRNCAIGIGIAASSYLIPHNSEIIKSAGFSFGMLAALYYGLKARVSYGWENYLENK